MWVDVQGAAELEVDEARTPSRSITTARDASGEIAAPAAALTPAHLDDVAAGVTTSEPDRRVR